MRRLPKTPAWLVIAAALSVPAAAQAQEGAPSWDIAHGLDLELGLGAATYIDAGSSTLASGVFPAGPMGGGSSSTSAPATESASTAWGCALHSRGTTPTKAPIPARSAWGTRRS